MPPWHIITGEYPPQRGGVSDYTRLIADGLAGAGDEVHVWCPSTAQGSIPDSRVTVHRDLGKLTPADLLRTGKKLNTYAPPRRLLVQWVPHAYGYRSLNVMFCLWIAKRALVDGDTVDIMVHEPFLPFRLGSIKGSVAAVIHRLMITLLLSATELVWMSIPTWESRLRPYVFRKSVHFRWSPIPSTMPMVAEEALTLMARRAYAPKTGCLLGHFGAYDPSVTQSLKKVIVLLLEERAEVALLLLGKGSLEAREVILKENPHLQDRIFATGAIAASEVAADLSACDVLLQPYPDGVSTRRTSLMAGLALGCAIVTTKGELTEPIWSESSAVSFVDAERASELLEVVRDLLSNAAERKRLGTAARALYMRDFHPKNTIAVLRAARLERDA